MVAGEILNSQRFDTMLGVIIIANAAHWLLNGEFGGYFPQVRNGQ